MEHLFVFLVHAQAHLILFGLGYLVFYWRNPTAELNRIYLLFSLLASALLPLMPSFLSITANGEETTAFWLPELVVAASGAVAEGTEAFSVTASTHAWILLLFGLLYAVLILLFLVRLISLMGLMTGTQFRKVEGMRLVVLKPDRVPFSFFGWLFIPEGLENDPAFRHILIHEKAHARRLHSADILLTEILRLLFWMNPVFYYMRRELKAMHEYEADAYALSHCERFSYQKALVEMNFRGLTVPLTNPYNVSLIKKRMLMMNKNSKTMSSTKPWLLSGTLVMLVLVALILQSFKPIDSEIKEASPAEPQMLEQNLLQNVSVEDSLFTVVEEMPEYPGGSEAMMKFLIENIKYPEQARKDSIQGRVFVNFIIEVDGKVSNAKVLRGIGGGCDEEAVRVVSLMPAWTPGKQRGKNVRVAFNLPIKFALDPK
jgi:TonB family protein